MISFFFSFFFSTLVTLVSVTNGQELGFFYTLRNSYAVMPRYFISLVIAPRPFDKASVFYLTRREALDLCPPFVKIFTLYIKTSMDSSELNTH
jgi:hypothetical protein